MLSKPPTYVKAIFTLIVTPLSILVGIVVGDVGIGDLNQGQWLTIILATVLATGGVYGLKNDTPPQEEL